ncbi:DgyrCDS9085 [Dimorphilus gyrociliatus]|uniref:DgyrCDS9085 n=1 Tax=Dimorphilus gyrociliatus TaxID=2664684 RepID=A0A7I8VXJ2_9ANNE|nr:DgyrCDS9085 [Dimorphilus gyrociliatus]
MSRRGLFAFYLLTLATALPLKSEMGPRQLAELAEALEKFQKVSAKDPENNTIDKGPQKTEGGLSKDTLSKLMSALMDDRDRRAFDEPMKRDAYADFFRRLESLRRGGRLGQKMISLRWGLGK